MTLRRYAPLSLVALAVACQPKIEERTNASTVDYAAFDPAGDTIAPPTKILPTPNDVAVNQFLAADPGPTYLPCDLAPGGATYVQLCAYGRAGGFPVVATANVTVTRGTLQGDGRITYGLGPLAGHVDLSTVAFAGASLVPSIAVLDLTSHVAVTTATAHFDGTNGALQIAPPPGFWTAGHQYAVAVRGGASGVKTTDAAPYAAIPAFYVLREMVIANLDPTLTANQGLFKGTDAQKAASGAALKPLWIAYKTLYAGTNASLTAAHFPFEEVVSLQTFQIAPGGTIDIGDSTASLAHADVSAGTTAPHAFDAFTLETTGIAATATLTAVMVDLRTSTVPNPPASVFISAAQDCSGTPLGTAAAPSVTAPFAVAVTHFLSATPTSGSTNLFLCATAPATGTGDIAGTVSGVSQFPGLAFTVTDNDVTGVTITVN